jgi:hypothetical protein
MTRPRPGLMRALTALALLITCLALATAIR